MEVDDNHLIGIIKDKGVVNIQELCRILNGRDFKYCHSKQPRGTDYDDRMDGQFVKQCLDCDVHYRDVHKQVMRLIKEKKIQSDKRIFYDRKDDDWALRMKNDRGRKKDLFRFLFVDFEVYKKKVLSQTLEEYLS